MNHLESNENFKQLSSMIFINADLNLIIECFTPPVVITISFLQVTFPFSSSPGESAVFAFRVSGQLNGCAF